MEALRETRVTLVDLLDKVLEKGLVIQADIIISVAGIPLIGVNLRAALAGMETMLKYGVMQDWDVRSRAWEPKHREKEKPSLLAGEEIIFKTFGSYYYSQGIYTAWRFGHLYLTGGKLFLSVPNSGEILFETPLKKIKGLKIKKARHFAGQQEDNEEDVWRSLMAVKKKKPKTREELHLLLEEDEVARLHSLNTNQLKEAIEKQMTEKGLIYANNPVFPELEERAAKFLTEGEDIAYRGKMWYLMPGSGIIGNTWKPGYLYITNKRLCWWYDFEQKIGFEIPLDKITAVTTEIRDLSPVVKQKEALDVIYEPGQSKSVACFSGKELSVWTEVLNRIIAQRVTTTGKGKEEVETCPQCGREAPVKALLEKGCLKCGWVSPKLKKRIAQLINP